MLENEALRIFTVKDVIRMTSLGRTSIWKLRAEGKLGSLKIGKRVLFTWNHIREFIQATQQ